MKLLPEVSNGTSISDKYNEKCKLKKWILKTLYILLMEVKEKSNNTFHEEWQKIEETQEQLIKQQFLMIWKNLETYYKNFQYLMY